MVDPSLRVIWNMARADFLAATAASQYKQRCRRDADAVVGQRAAPGSGLKAARPSEPGGHPPEAHVPVRSCAARSAGGRMQRVQLGRRAVARRTYGTRLDCRRPFSRAVCSASVSRRAGKSLVVRQLDQRGRAQEPWARPFCFVRRGRGGPGRPGGPGGPGRPGGAGRAGRAGQAGQAGRAGGVAVRAGRGGPRRRAGGAGKLCRQAMQGRQGRRGGGRALARARPPSRRCKGTREADSSSPRAQPVRSACPAECGVPNAGSRSRRPWSRSGTE